MRMRFNELVATGCLKSIWKVTSVHRKHYLCEHTVHNLVLCSLNDGPRVPNISFVMHFWRLAWVAHFPAITRPCYLLRFSGFFCIWCHTICVQCSLEVPLKKLFKGEYAENASLFRGILCGSCLRMWVLMLRRKRGHRAAFNVFLFYDLSIINPDLVTQFSGVLTPAVKLILGSSEKKRGFLTSSLIFYHILMALFGHWCILTLCLSWPYQEQQIKETMHRLWPE